MAILRRPAQLKENTDTGFGTNPENYGGRFVNRDGSFNVRKEGVPFFKRFSLYYAMLNMPAWKFYGSLFLFYITINFVFALIYFAIGRSEFTGILGTTTVGFFKEMYFF